MRHLIFLIFLVALSLPVNSQVLKNNGNLIKDFKIAYGGETYTEEFDRITSLPIDSVKSILKDNHFSIMVARVLVEGPSKDYEEVLYNFYYLYRTALVSHIAYKHLSMLNQAKGEDHYYAGSTMFHAEYYTEAANWLSAFLLLPIADNSYLISEARKQRGIARTELMDFYGAEEDLSAAVALGSSDTRVYLSRAMCYMRLKHYDKALDDYDSCIALKPGDPVAFYNKGLLFIQVYRDKANGCRSLSTAGSLGHKRAYEMIREYCN